MELVKEFNSDKYPDLKFVCLETLPLPDADISWHSNVKWRTPQQSRGVKLKGGNYKKHLCHSSFITWSFSQTSLVTSWLAELTFWRIDILLKYFAPAARSDPTATFNLARVLAEEQPFMSHTRLNPAQWLLWVSKAVLRSSSISILWSDRHFPQWVLATEKFCWGKKKKNNQ